ncbi:uncharacterized protein LOC127709920 [Mytilus californianus]|uniref:uncharacterized protein LOC127709920 n=1 Tax=Mytilus californianus TaxID=6549 RepID=UPI00224612B8|nr:uncharacterized protein LOC127709920 [Mytilus californianus]
MVKNVKIVFLGIFTVTCITFHAMRVSIHIVCPESSTTDNILRIVYDCEISLFYVLQFTFIMLYSKRIVYPSCLTHFGATVLAVTNAATFISHSTKAYFEEKGDHQKITDCLNQTITYEVYHSIKPFLDPTLLENALFAILFINDIFSSCKVRSGENNPATDQTLKDPRSVELPVNAQSLTKRPIRKWISIVCFGSIICSPYVVIRLVQSHNDHEQPFALYITQTVFFLIFKSLNYLAVIKCFYFLRRKGQQHVKSSTTSLNLSHYLILLSAFGTVIYFGLHLIASFVSREKLYLMGNIMNMMATFVQTILILQMKDYQKINDKTKISSISNMFLFLSITNLGLWVYATFIEAHFIYKQFYAVQFYGYETMLMVKNIVLPMCIFYRFKCFLAFLDLSGYFFSCICNKQTSKRGSYERM